MRSQPTQFLPDLPATSWRARLYVADRMHVAGLSILRWVYILAVAGAIIWLLGRLPGSWLIAVLWLVSALALNGAACLARNTQYVTFTQTTAQLPPGICLPASAKIPVYVTGCLSVEQKERTFAMVPGFYRTFATREHALLCRVDERRLWGLATWPEEEIGLWYAFFTPPQIIDISLGSLLYGAYTLETLAVTYRPAPASHKGYRTPEVATLYLSFPDSAGYTTAVADLMVEWHVAIQRTDRQ